MIEAWPLAAAKCNGVDPVFREQKAIMSSTPVILTSDPPSRETGVIVAGMMGTYRGSLERT